MPGVFLPDFVAARRPLLAVCSLAGALAATPAAQAAEAAASRIERVTVYPGLALVERSAKVAAGARELVLDCLSPSFDMATLQLDAGEGLRLGPVSATNRPRAEVPACDATPLDGRILALEDKLALLQAESSGHELVLGLLRGLGGPEPLPADASPSARPANAAAGRLGSPVAASASTSASGLQALLSTVQRSGQDALAQQHRLGREREALERELQPLLAERERLRGQGGEVRQLRISLSASRDTSLGLRYQVSGPSWAPAYRATLDADALASANPSVLLERQAQVSQRSGEDWRGVALRLSTGSPRGASAGPEPRPWSVFPRPPVVAERRAMAPMALAAPAPLAMAKASADAVALEEPMDFAVQQVDGDFATEFEVPGRVDVASGGQRVSLVLGQQRLPVKLAARAVPQQDPSAWLVAELARPEGVWPDGPLQLQRGSQVVGASVWRVGDGERLSLPFGRDEQLRVRVLPAQQATATSGFIGSRHERRVGHVYELENRHRLPLAVQVLEASPVSSDAQISVTRQFNPAPQPGDWQDQPGVVAWQATLAPGQKARFTADYLISHPKDLAVQDSR